MTDVVRTLLRRPAIGRLLRVATLLLVGAALAFYLWRLPWQELRAALARARPGFIGAAVALTVIITALRGAALKILAVPVARIPLLRAIGYTIAASTGSILAPLRAGDALRAVLLTRREGMSLAACGAVFLYERAGDVGSLLVLCSPLPWLLGPLPDWNRWALWGLTVTAVVASVAVVATRRTAWGAALRRTAGPIGRGRTLGPAAAAMFSAWLADVLAVMAVLHAVGIPASAPIAIFVLLAVNLAIVVPMPANAGTLELGAVVALQTLSIGSGRALAFAILYHATQVFPTLALGLLTAAFTSPGPRAQSLGEHPADAHVERPSSTQRHERYDGPIASAQSQRHVADHPAG